ncbi:FtsH protease activity modulator HflK [Candidatus Pantoea edessiphila]|uniref:Protein HflK n=1 Tax=Candidatus Pantoea edessiphila TaxID=2044610 RepID=A0A2P5T1N8_9GAMM|nr:FtsH protease activity modulator HflK [Candidatus Pantoea edessiphila]PPI88497.1 FtsH protease activity modulator HflK [Candidatus Pantoea edessiphila]
MILNHPGNKQYRRDPLGNDKINLNNKKNFNLRCIIKNLIKKISAINNNKSNNMKKRLNIITYKVVFIVLISVIFTWILSGFYTIQEAECGIVARFGKFIKLAESGLNWKLNFIDQVNIVNIKKIRELNISGIMLTSDEDLVNVEINVQYKIVNPKYYLYSVINSEESLIKATNSALRNVIGKTNIEDVFYKGNDTICHDIKYQIKDIISPYKIGVSIIDVNIRHLQLPNEVESSFKDFIKAKENKENYIIEANNYSEKLKLIAKNKAKFILEKAHILQKQKLLKARGEVERFVKMLEAYKASPKITREFLYIETLENILNHARKVLIDVNKNNLILLPTDFKNGNISLYELNKKQDELNKKQDELNKKQDELNKKQNETYNIKKSLSTYNTNNQELLNNTDELNKKQNDIIDKRKSNTFRNNIKREKREEINA